MAEAKSILIHNKIPFAHISDYDCIIYFNFIRLYNIFKYFFIVLFVLDNLQRMKNISKIKLLM